MVSSAIARNSGITVSQSSVGIEIVRPPRPASSQPEAIRSEPPCSTASVKRRSAPRRSSARMNWCTLPRPMIEMLGASIGVAAAVDQMLAVAARHEDQLVVVVPVRLDGALGDVHALEQPHLDDRARVETVDREVG